MLDWYVIVLGHTNVESIAQLAISKSKIGGRR